MRHLDPMLSPLFTREEQEEEGVRMEPLEVVRQMFEAMERGDTARMSELYSPVATIWHNDGHGDQSASDNIALLSAFHQVISDLRYDVKRRFAVAGGVFQSHVARGTLPDGEGFAVDAAVYLGVADGRVTRVEEYFDPRSLAKIEEWAGRCV